MSGRASPFPEPEAGGPHRPIRIPRLTLRRLVRATGLLRRYATPFKLANLLRAELAFRRRTVRVASLPYLFRADPTTRCGAACPYCWRSISAPLPPATLSLDTFRAGFEPFRAACLLTSFQMFGEPLLSDALPDLVSLAHRAGSATYVSTSLQREDDGCLARLLSSGLDLLTVAVDAATPETYARMKPGADFDLLRRNLDRLFALRRNVPRPPAIGFQVLVTRLNEPELPAIRDLALRLGADYLDLKPTLFLPDSTWVPRDPRHQVARLARAGRVCSMPWTTITLLADGRYFPCCAFPAGFDLGPVGQSAQEVWNGERLREIRRGFRTGAPTPLCAECPLGRLPRF